MVIRNNGPARRSYNSYRSNNGALSKNLEKLSSGYRINRSADDAAGLAISEKMRASLTGLDGAQRNAKHGIGLIQVTEGALQEYHEIVNRMLELSVKSANATYDDDVDREQLQKEMNRLAQELNRIADSTNANGIFTLNGSSELVEDAKFRELVSDDVASLSGFTEEWQAPMVSSNGRGVAHADGYSVAPTEGTPAMTSVDFSGKTGADLVGQFMLLGHAGEHGKYQLVENAADAVEGYEPIVIEASDDASQLAQKISDAIGDLENFNVSYDENVITVQETQNQGAKSVPITFGTEEPDEYDEWMGLFNASIGEIDATLFWNTEDDLDLYCKTPSGQQICYYHTTADNGVLEFDKIPSLSNKDLVGEHLYFQKSDDLLPGKYEFWVNNYSDKGSLKRNTASFLRIKIGDQKYDFDIPVLGHKNNSAHFSFEYVKSDAWEGPKITNSNGVAATTGYEVPERIGTAATTTVDFTDSTVGNLLGGKIVVLSENKRDLYQFVLNGSDVEAGYTPIELGQASLLSADDEDRADAIAEQVLASLNAIDGFNFNVSGGKLSITEAENGGKKAVAVYPLAPDESDEPEPEVETEPDNPAPDDTSSLSPTGKIRLQIGETGDEYNVLEVPKFDMHTDKVGLGDVDISTQKNALDAIDKLKSAVNQVSDVRGTYGALQNRLEHTINYLGNAHENTQSAESLIRDTDMADEMMKYTKNSILTQSAQSMMAQANMLPQGVLQLMQ